MDADAFVRANTALTAPPLLPEISLHLATEVTPLWEATEETLERFNVPPPYWAFAWVGGQAVARLVLDRPELVAGKRVLDFASGSGIAGVAAAKAGAARVVSAEIDAFALAAIRLNAEANGVTLEVTGDDLVGGPLAGFDVVLAGDVFYEKPMTDRVEPWLRSLAAGGAFVVVGDPGRAYLPKQGLEFLARTPVPTTIAIEDREMRETTVWRLLPG
ncbi:MAG TPA: 50S ribosomal protein L11 methyltransferase [Azospirillaceae bacterium]|nr:50S ribosomal protein L11 methyltransferase [Azospirillaceae bacterium]